MKSIKLLACLVTLQFTVGLTLEAAESSTFREWTDAKGRQITARLVETTDAGSVKIERKDGQVFTVAVAVFSKADQAYVETFRAAQKTEIVAAGQSAETPLAKASEADTPKAKFAANTSSRSASATEQLSFFGVPLAP